MKAHICRESGFDLASLKGEKPLLPVAGEAAPAGFHEGGKPDVPGVRHG